MMKPAPGTVLRIALTISMAIGVGLWLAGCATSSDEAARIFVAPGKYELYDCPQLERAATEFTKREEELAKLMEKAKQGAGGGLVSALSYETEYYSIRADLIEIRKTQSVKNCPPPPVKR
jgi:hypothetical protein